jgi:hypothetical protein
MRRTSTLLALAGAVALIATAAPASANAVDDAFIAAIDGYPVPYSTAAEAVTLARVVCEQVAAGQTIEAIAIDIGQPANWTVPQSVFFVETSVRSYCPPTATAPASAVQAPPAIVQPPVPVVQIPMPSSAYFANCSAARGAGSAPLYAGQPGYRSALDRDGDGVAANNALAVPNRRSADH